jgi:hypothetical protein
MSTAMSLSDAAAAPAPLIPSSPPSSPAPIAGNDDHRDDPITAEHLDALADQMQNLSLPSSHRDERSLTPMDATTSLRAVSLDPPNATPAYPSQAAVPSHFGHATAIPELRLNMPEKYDGRRVGTACEDWISEMRDYIEFYAARGAFRSEAEKIQVAANRLTGRARKIWNVRKRLMASDTEGRMQVRSLEEFFRIIRLQCTDYNADERIRQRYDRLRQTRSVREYAIDLLDLADQLKQRPPDFEILHRFKSGLRDHVLEELYKIYEPPNNLFDFIELCDRIDNHWYSRQRLRKDLRERAQNNAYGERSYGERSRAPDNRESKPRTDRTSSGTNRDRPNSDRPRKGTPEWRQWCADERRCFLCGDKGHSGRNCPKNRDTVNNVNEVTFNVSNDNFECDNDDPVYSDCESEKEKGRA